VHMWSLSVEVGAADGRHSVSQTLGHRCGVPTRLIPLTYDGLRRASRAARPQQMQRRIILGDVGWLGPFEVLTLAVDAEA